MNVLKGYSQARQLVFLTSRRTSFHGLGEWVRGWGGMDPKQRKNTWEGGGLGSKERHMISDNEHEDKSFTTLRKMFKVKNTF